MTLGLLVVVPATATVTDLKWRRVPNWLSLPALAAGLVLHLATGGGKGLAAALLMTAICGGIFFALYWLGGMGAGDVKLMAAVAALASFPTALYAMVYTAVAGGLIAVALLIARGRLAGTLRGMLASQTWKDARATADAEDDAASPGAKGPAEGHLYIPYAPAIAVGTILAVMYQP
jgi:prepilin peptidase CpaA